MNRFLYACCLMTAILTTSCSNNYKSMSEGQLLDLADKAAENGNWSEALELANLAAERNPESVNALLMQAISLQGLGKFQQAMQYARKAAEKAPEKFLPQYIYGRICAKNVNTLQDCIVPLKKALSLKKNDANTLVLLADASRKLKLPDTVEYYRQLTLTRRFAKDTIVWNTLGAIYAERKDSLNATRCFVKAYNLDPQNPDSALNLAILLDNDKPNYRQRAVAFYKKYLLLTENQKGFENTRNKVKLRIRTLQSIKNTGNE